MYLVPSLIVFNHECMFKNQNRKLESYTIFPISSQIHRKHCDGKWEGYQRLPDTWYTPHSCLILSPWQPSPIDRRIPAYRDHRWPQTKFLPTNWNWLHCDPGLKTKQRNSGGWRAPQGHTVKPSEKSGRTSCSAVSHSVESETTDPVDCCPPLSLEFSRQEY